MKKSLLKTCSACLLAGTIPMTVALGACSGKQGTANNADTLEILVLDAGYGTSWCDAVAEAFKADPDMSAAYPNLEIVVDSSTEKSSATGQMAMGEKNTVDLIFGQGLAGYYGTTEVENLTKSVYEKNVPGESVTFMDKMTDSILADYYYRDVKGNNMSGYYGVPWQGGQLGITYNADMLEEYNIEVPRTSQELIEACETITTANAGKKEEEKDYAIIQSTDAKYWDMYFFSTWWAQYDGIQNYVNFYEGIYEDSDGARYSNEIFNREGRLRSLEEFEKIMDMKKGFISPSSFRDEFMVAQTSFLLGAAAFHVNGVYFTREMEGIAEKFGDECETIKLMRSPVLSSVIELCNDLENDDELSALVKAIDEGKKDLKGEGYEVSQATYDKIKEARYTVNGAAGNTMGIIPSYAVAKDAAIDFVRFMATDKALAIYAQETKGTLLDFDFDIKNYDGGKIYNEFAPLNKGYIDYYTSDLAYGMKILRAPQSFPLYNYAELRPFSDTVYWDAFTADTVTKHASDFFEDTKKNWTVEKFNNALEKAGVQ